MSSQLAVLFLHQGKIAEMATGEGKTLVASTLPAYLNALAGRVSILLRLMIIWQSVIEIGCLHCMNFWD